MKQKIEGEQIYLKPVSEEHIEAFVRWTNDPEVNKFTTGRGYNLEEEKDWLKEMQENPNENIFSIFLKENDKIIGNCGLHCNYQLKEEFNGKTFFGIMIGEKDEWRKGYGTDAIHTISKYAKDVMKESELYLSVDAVNEGAKKLYEKCGFETVLKWHNPKRHTVSKDEYIMRKIL
jgi:RimJ/RimL family protein N-acetyltransferase